MNYYEQQDLLQLNVPKLTDVEQYIFKNKYINIYSNYLSDFVYPITRVLLQTYQYFNGTGFDIRHTKWGLSTIQSMMEQYGDDFDALIKGQYELNTDVNKLIIIHVTRGYEIFEPAKKHTGYIPNASLALQAEQNHKIAVVKISDNCTVILTNRFASETMQSFFSIVPIVFSKDKLPEKILNAFLALSEDDHNTIMEILNDTFKDMNFTEFKRKAIADIFKGTFNNINAIKNIDNSLQMYKRNLEDYYKNILDGIRTIKELEMKRLAMESMDYSKMQEEVARFITTNKFIKDTKVINSNVLQLRIETPIFFIDEKQLQKIIDTPASYLNSFADSKRKPKIKKFMTETFIDKKYLLWTTTIVDFKLNYLNEMLNGQNRRGPHDIFTIKRDSSGAKTIPQPHLTYHSCYGANEIHLMKALEANDVIGLLAQLIASCQNLNFGDGLVSKELLTDVAVNYSNSKSIEIAETGEKISYTEWEERN